MTNSYRISPFDLSSFSSDVLLKPPPMDPQDAASFLRSLEARTIPELVAAVRLWEDHFMVAYRGPFFLVRVADVFASLNSSATALILYQEALASMEADPVFSEFLAKFEEKCHADEEIQRTRWAQGVFNQSWKPTNKIIFPTIPTPPEWMPALQQQWTSMRERPGDLIQQYFRYFCIESNMMEQTFLLNSRSLIQLTRDGYDESAVNFLDSSPLQDKILITEILRDTHKALEMILQVAHDPSKLTVDFLRDIHRVCMKTSKILPMKIQDGGGELHIRHLNVGVTRQVSRKNVIIPGPPRVQFCPFEDVDAELGKFTHLARQWLKNWKRNPFATAAWLHLVFATCRPFEDGNGRVARLIASIPLIEAGLPPLCIPPSAKKAYFDGLGQARENDYEPLIQCFFQALIDSASTIENLD